MKAGTWIIAVLVVSLMAMTCPGADAPAPAKDGKVQITPARSAVTYDADVPAGDNGDRPAVGQ